MTKWTEHRERPVSDLHDWPDAGAGDQSVSSLEGINSPVYMSWVKDMKDIKVWLLLYIAYSLTYVCCSKPKEQ